MSDMKRNVFQSFILLLVISLVTNASLLVVPLFSLQIFDRVLSSASFETLYMLLLAAIIIGLFHCYFEYRRQHLPALLLQHCFAQNHEKAAKNCCYSADSGVYREFSKLLSGNVSSVMLAAIDACFCPLFICVLYLLHTDFAILVTFTNVICIVLFYFQYKVLSQRQSELAGNHQGQAKNISELTCASKNLLADDRISGWLATSRAAELNESSLKLKVVENRFKSLFLLNKWCLQLVLPTIGASLLLNNQITTGTLLAAIIIGYRGIIPFEIVFNQWQMCDKILDLKKKWQQQFSGYDSQSKKVLPITDLTGKLRVDNLTIHDKKTGVELLSSVSFSLEPGESLAILGANGSGKSLLIDSLLGVGPKYTGNIYFDEYRKCNVDNAWLGEQVGYVPQNLCIPTASIAQIICRYQKVDNARILDVAKQMAVHEYIVSQPMGYDTQVGMYGETMPPGVMQRLLIASAIYVKPKYLFFDEADSFLDQAGQQVFKQLLKAMQDSRITLVYVTQKRSMVDMAQRVLLLDKGRVFYTGDTQGLNLSLIRGQS